MKEAVEAVHKGMGYREAARGFNVPVETLRRRVIGAVQMDAKPGPPTVLSKEEEDLLAKYVVDMADMGFGLSREDVMQMAFTIAERTGKKHPFKKMSMLAGGGMKVLNIVIHTLPFEVPNRFLIVVHYAQTKQLLMTFLPSSVLYMVGSTC